VHENLALACRILYRHWSTEEDMSTEDRRTPGATRVAFDGLVEVGAAVGTAFEAQAVNVSKDGMQLRTSYLPQPGQPLSCRFDAGSGECILASGEVVWARGDDRGGEFGVRFTDMDSESVEGLRHIVGLASSASIVERGGKVRLHIDGLASPMRAKVKESSDGAVTVGSDLGFLQVGKELELEDAKSGTKRSARIDRVDVAVDAGSHVPQLVVTLSYADATMRDVAADPSSASETAARSEDSFHGSSAERASRTLAGSTSRVVERMRDSIAGFARSATTTVVLLARRARRASSADVERSPRRTTAPAPSGGLHTEGRRVLRSQVGEDVGGDDLAGSSERRAVLQRRALVVGAAVLALTAVSAAALKATRHDSARDTAASARSAESVAEASGAPSPSSVAAASSVLPSASPMAANSASSAARFAPLPPPGSTVDGTLAASDDDSARSTHKKHAHVTPFANGSVHHGNTLRLRMDGPIESIEGSPQANGFTVKIAGRRSLEAAAPLAARDSRIASMKVTNEASGADLFVSFRDTVPNYRVSAHGDMLVLTLAPPGALERPVAKRDDKSERTSKHSSHPRTVDDVYER